MHMFIKWWRGLAYRVFFPIREGVKHRIVSMFIVFGLIFAGVSPFCVTKEGGVLLEICGANGMQTVSLDQSPFIPDDGQDTPSEKCLYCFVLHMAKTDVSLPALTLVDAIIHQQYNFSFEDLSLIELASLNYVSRAPPLMA